MLRSCYTFQFWQRLCRLMVLRRLCLTSLCFCDLIVNVLCMVTADNARGEVEWTVDFVKSLLDFGVPGLLSQRIVLTLWGERMVNAKVTKMKRGHENATNTGFFLFCFCWQVLFNTKPKIVDFWVAVVYFSIVNRKMLNYLYVCLFHVWLVKKQKQLYILLTELWRYFERKLIKTTNLTVRVSHKYLKE